VGILESYVVMFILATGISGLSITVAMNIRNENRFDVVIATAELVTVRVRRTATNARRRIMSVGPDG